jgi:LysM repeat protein
LSIDRKAVANEVVKRARTLVAILTLGLAACTGGGLSNSVPYSPSPPLALVALIDPTPDRMTAELQQLAGVVRAGASPNEAIVVMLVSPGTRTYTVRPGDSLSSIASSNNLTLAQIETANPQLGPVAGRNWSLIHSDEHVTLPDREAPNTLLLVTRAPAGPPPPMLIRLPSEPSNPTDYQRAQYERAIAADNATNSSRIAAWRASVDKALLPWQNAVAAQLDSGTRSTDVTLGPPSGAAVSASILAGLTTLAGLSGRRLLLVLSGGGAAPTTFAPSSLSGITLVVANVADAGVAAAWTAAAREAGAVSSRALDPALTQLQLAQVVNS